MTRIANVCVCVYGFLVCANACVCVHGELACANACVCVHGELACVNACVCVHGEPLYVNVCVCVYGVLVVGMYMFMCLMYLYKKMDVCVRMVNLYVRRYFISLKDKYHKNTNRHLQCSTIRDPHRRYHQRDCLQQNKPV